MTTKNNADKLICKGLRMSLSSHAPTGLGSGRGDRCCFCCENIAYDKTLGRWVIA